MVYTTHIDAFEAATAARRRFYGGHLPAASWIGVQRLYAPELKVEIEIITARAALIDQARRATIRQLLKGVLP